MIKRILGAGCAAAYVATIWLANYLVSHYGIVDVGFGLMAPAAVYAAGLAFTMRDLTQDLIGKRAVLACIAVGAAASYGISPVFATASAAAFAVSELADFAVYTPLRKRQWLGAVTASNIVGSALDSAIFLQLAFGSLAFFQGQMVGKLTMTAIAVGVLALARSSRRVLAQA